MSRLLERFFGKCTKIDDKLCFRLEAPAGARTWLLARSREVCSDLSVHARQPVLDADTVDTLVTCDGWIYRFTDRSWTKNTLRAGYLRVCAKTREQLEAVQSNSSIHAALIATFWKELRIFEAAGGKTLVGHDEQEQEPVLTAFDALLDYAQSPTASPTWFRALYQAVGRDLDVLIYLVKVA